MCRSYYPIVFLLLLSLGWQAGLADQLAPPLPTASAKPGRYEHQLYGANAWYKPDDSGKYRHDPRPYDGGYGDRGQPYANDLQGIFRQAEEQLAARVQDAGGNFALGPRDHLRFMIDFNYNGTGWQIIKFEWVRDADGSEQEQRQFNYVNENRLWETDMPGTAERQNEQQAQYDIQPAQAYEYQQPQDADCEPVEQQQGVYADSKNIKPEHDPQKVQSTINEVLEYIQQHILPTLN